MDQAITSWINGPAGNSSLLDSVMTLASLYGVPVLVLLVAAQWWSRVNRPHIRHICVASGLAVLGGLAANQVILLFVHRLRPYDAGVSHLIIDRSADWSFPSDHATVTVAIAATFLLHGLSRRGVGFAVAAAVVCLSRVYVGTHYLSDVLGGAVIGCLAAGLVRVAYWEGTWADRLVTRIL
jgi:undecaprenyl-diphosphatase